jgi:ubiquinone/menaquinone biosynthesis C-methylase UbiE
LTPFYIGELLRAVLVGRKYPHHRADIVYIWFLERACDFLMLLLFATTKGRLIPHAVVFAVLWILSIAVIRFRFRLSSLTNWPRLSAVAVALCFSFAAWSLTAAALSGVLYVMNSPLSLLDSSSTFAYTTIAGSITGVPVGIGIAGSLLVKHLTAQSVPQSLAILCTLIFRLGTVWFIVAVGAITIILKWKTLLARLRSHAAGEHFDDIAPTYRQRIPEHVRRRLLTRKVQYMTNAVRSSGPKDTKRGLDVGCGHGWYACEMAGAGCRMYAVDSSQPQIRMARKYAVEQGVSVQFLRADATDLPFEDNHFDFAYAINVLHHVIDPDQQLQVLREIVRVLKPGGTFFLQEVNTLNPLFRFYLGYVFPLIRGIDEGNERWIRPDRLPDLPGATWQKDKLYFTFLPDFIPGFLLKPLAGLERYLEKSPIQQGSAHYIARLIKHENPAP